MAALSELSPRALVDALGVVAAVLADHAEALDGLEVSGDDLGAGFDSDSMVREGELSGRSRSAQVGSGTDLAATLEAACSEAESAKDLRSVATSLHSGAEAAARGSAGRGLTTVLQALSEVTNNTDVVDAERLALALELAGERLDASSDVSTGSSEVGTLPAVVVAASTGALSALDQGLSLGDVLISASDSGLVELEAGPVSNPTLAERGAVDAGAAGFLLVLDALAAVVTDEPIPEAPKEHLGGAESGGSTGDAATSGAPAGGSTIFEIRCTVLPHEGCGVESAAWLESTWYEIGRLLTFEVKSDKWNVHVHTTLPGAAIEALCSVGAPSEMHIGVVSHGGRDGDTDGPVDGSGESGRGVNDAGTNA